MVQQVASRHATTLIPRHLLFGNPERTEPRLSPDGNRMAWLAPDARDVRQVWVGTRSIEEGRCVTADRKRGISFYGWSWDSRKIIYIQDSDGDENYHMYAVDLETGNVRDLTPWQGITAAFVASSRKHPDHLLVALNVRDRAKHDVRRINIDTAEVRLDRKTREMSPNGLPIPTWKCEPLPPSRRRVPMRSECATAQMRRGGRLLASAPKTKFTRLDLTGRAES